MKNLKKHNLKFRIVCGNLDLNENPTPNDMTSESKKLYFTKKDQFFAQQTFLAYSFYQMGKSLFAKNYIGMKLSSLAI